MPLVSATALHDIEYNGAKGRAEAKAGVVVHDLTEEECDALEDLGAVERLKKSSVPEIRKQDKRAR